jgi:hypothetical protein
MAFRTTQQFILDTDEVVLPAPEPGTVRRVRERVQNAAASASGGLFIDDKNAVRTTVRFDLALTDVQLQALQAFYDDVVRGGVEDFTWIDHESKTWSGVRFAPGPLECARTPGLRHRLTVHLMTTQLFGV